MADAERITEAEALARAYDTTARDFMLAGRMSEAAEWSAKAERTRIVAMLQRMASDPVNGRGSYGIAAELVICDGLARSMPGTGAPTTAPTDDGAAT